MKQLLLSVCIFMTVPFQMAWPQTSDGWRGDLYTLLAAEDGQAQEKLLKRFLKQAPAWQEVREALRTQTFPAPGETGLHLRQNLCSDGVERPYVIFVPEDYDPTRPTPLLIALHGGVSRAEIAPDPMDHASNSPYLDMARERSMLVIWPMGQSGATWWDRVGMDNVKAQVKTTKRAFNVDDDRVYVIGFSDGASAAFAWGMLDGGTYAALLALSGHLGVGHSAGALSTYACNLANTPVYAVTSFEDSLYPSAAMGPVMDMLIEAGGDVYYREQEGPHNFSYAADELPRVLRFMDRHVRDPYAPRLSWETAGPEFGHCKWLSVGSVTGDHKVADWHQSYNAQLTNNRITIGFMPAADFEGAGVKIGKVSKDSFATEIGLLEGDILVRADDVTIRSARDLSAWKAGVARGDAVKLKVKRGRNRKTLKGRLPAAKAYPLFNYEVPSGKVRASFAANRVKLESSRVASLELLIDPDMFRLERAVTITINGKEVFAESVQGDLEFMLRRFLEHRDRGFLPVAKLPFDL